MKCPRCKSKKIHKSGRERVCEICKQRFDPVDDGNYHSDPTKRLRLEESRSEKRKQLKGGL